MQPPKSIFYLALLLVLSSCSNNQKKAPLPVFEVLQPMLKNATYHKEYVAEIQSVRYVEVRSRVNGYLEKIHVDEGQLVQEGQVIFSVSSKEFELELQKANAAYKVAVAELRASEVELTNVENLVSKNIMSQAELAMVKAKTDALKAKVEEALAHKEQAALNLSFSQIKAPYKGKINRIPLKVGSLVHAEDVLTTISDNSEVFAYFHLSEPDYLNYRNEMETEGQHVQLILSNNEAYPHDGKIEITESEFDVTTGNIAFRARFKNPEMLLKHGSNGKVRLRKKIPDALFIPQRSTFEIQDKLYVFVVGNDSIVRQQPVTTGVRIDNSYAIQNGLTVNDKIVFEGVQELREGDKVCPKVLLPEEVNARISNL